jgi:hypothetical protein
MWHQPGNSTQDEAHTALGQFGELGGIRMTRLEEHLHLDLHRFRGGLTMNALKDLNKQLLENANIG